MKFCAVAGCNGLSSVRGWCAKHYTRWQRHGDPTVNLRVDNKRGWISDEGYRRTRIDGRVIAVHRQVMASVLGRPLEAHENVHHINGDRLDNRPENLELWATKQPRGQRIEDLVAHAHEILARYG